MSTDYDRVLLERLVADRDERGRQFDSAHRRWQESTDPQERDDYAALMERLLGLIRQDSAEIRSVTERIADITERIADLDDR